MKPVANIAIGRLRHAVRLAVDRFGDRLFGINTVIAGALPHACEDCRFRDAFVNGPVSYGLLWRFVGKLNLCPGDVFYDIGCGDGRVLCFVARHPVTRCVGIELSREFASRARTNVARLRHRASPVEVRTGDAVDMDYSDGTAFYFGDPFGELTMREVLRKIGVSVDLHPRPVRCVFVLRRDGRAGVQDAIRKSGWLSFAGRLAWPFSPMFAEHWSFRPC